MTPAFLSLSTLNSTVLISIFDFGSEILRCNAAIYIYIAALCGMMQLHPQKCPRVASTTGGADDT